MAIDVQRESVFYDQQYAQLLAAPDDALACSREIIVRQINDPASPSYVRRKLYGAALRELFRQPLAGLRALDYGCGTGEWGVMLAVEGASVALLDVSPVAIEVGLRRARASGVADSVGGYARDASDLRCFQDGEFDLVSACAALHHTIKYAGAREELLRVLKPGGRLVLAEGWGNNPLLDGARRLHWHISGEPAEAGEGIIFNERDVAQLARDFSAVEVYPLNLFAMAKRAFRGRFENPLWRGLVTSLERTDAFLLALLPSLKRYCGEVVVVAVK
jgi:SAM-dependent methyltransferase